MFISRIATGLLTSIALIAAGEATAYEAVTIGEVSVRSGPGSSYPVVEKLAAGSSVDVSDCHGDWCMIEAGWVSSYSIESKRLMPTNYFYDYGYDFDDDDDDDGPGWYGHYHHDHHHMHDGGHPGGHMDHMWHMGGDGMGGHWDHMWHAGGDHMGHSAGHTGHAGGGHMGGDHPHSHGR